MADNVAITEGAGKTVLADEVTHGTLGTGVAQVTKMMDGTVGGTELMKILAPSTAPNATDPAVVVAISPNGMNPNGATTASASAPVTFATDQAWGVGSAGFTKLEDVAAANGDKGVPAYAVQTATPADAATDGRWAWLQMKNGRLFVQATIQDIGAGEYELVAASATTQALGATGATGDYLSHVLIIPETTGAGTVAIKDGSGTAINIFVSGTLSNLVPFTVQVGAYSTSGAWQVTTGTNVHCVAFGNFT
jgi:hypothetical protein